MKLADTPRRILMLGATGTIGRATTKALIAQGHSVTCFLRSSNKHPGLENIEVRYGDLSDPVSIRDDGFKGEVFDAIISCLASRTGSETDAWAIDHRAHSNVLQIAQDTGVPQMVLLSAICVQKPRLPFQHAKLAFEAELQASNLTWSIVRPTAFFKSLSGQIKRVQAGKPYLLFGDGALTACKPLSDRDLAKYLVDCLNDPSRHNQVLPIGGPGPALTPRQQGKILFDVTGKEPKFRSVPITMMKLIIGTLSTLGRVSPRLAAKAELARIGHYYATESMLLLNSATGHYDANATPETGTDTLHGHFEAVVRGDVEVDLGDHAVF